MELRELFEARLPLRSGMIDRVRGSYGAFVITMHPSDFLMLTTHGAQERQRIADRSFPEKLDDFYDPTHFGKFELPFLIVEFPSGKILGHEGRHRANMILNQGGDKFPVAIYPKEDLGYIAKVVYWDDAGHRREYHSDPFATEETARIAARRALDIPDDDIVRITTNYAGHRTLKGEPTRSQGWDRAAWRREDFPKQLIGQYTSNRVTDFQVGLVKGYRHFKRLGKRY